MSKRFPFATVALSFALSIAPKLALASNYELSQIPQAIPAKDATTLKTSGIQTTDTLLQRAADAKARKQLAKDTKISEETLLGWTQMADLLRIKGIGPDVARLLAAADVKTVEALKKADAGKVSDSMLKANAKLKLSENPPSLEHLKAWIEQAQTLPVVLK